MKQRILALFLGVLLSCTVYSALETGDYIDDLVVTNPTGSDDYATADDHLRLIKKVIQQSFPNIDGAVTASVAELNIIDGLTSSTAELNLLTGVTAIQDADDELTEIAALLDTDSNFIVGNGSAWVAESGATARTSLGVAIGSDVQAWDTELDDIAALTPTDSNFIVGDGVNWVAESGATARTSIGLATGDSPQFAGVNVGAATDTTITRVSAGIIAVEGSTVATRATGTYTGVVVGCTSDPGPTITWSKAGNHATVSIPSFSCTSNATNLLINGGPAAIWTAANRGIVPVAACRNSGTDTKYLCGATMGTSGQIALYYNSLVSTGYTASGSKGVPTIIQFTYMLD